MAILKLYLDPLSLHQVKTNVAKVEHPLTKLSGFARNVSLWLLEAVDREPSSIASLHHNLYLRSPWQLDYKSLLLILPAVQIV